MSWYAVDYACGHSGRMQIYGPHRDRQRQADTAGRKDCPECWRKKQDAINAAKYPAQLLTPAAIRLGMVGIQDHGLSLVHELGGRPRNYLHEVSVESHELDAIRYLQARGYALRCGWVKDGKTYWTYSKPFPLAAGER